MSTFNSYFNLGYNHILTLSALDHILFIIVLLTVYQSRHWLKMLIAISLFAVGHSVSLSLASLDLISVNKDLVEFLIPLTILVTSLMNLTKFGNNPNGRSKYWISIVFGLIHGLGFSTYYELLVLGEGKYWDALLPFNLGLEAGQLIIYVIFLVLTFVGQTFINIKQRDWVIFFSGLGFGLSLLMVIENAPNSLGF